jgi:DMSO/TMAO reductase YedYZ molybdopterin-dependent catalytic subunit
VKIFGSRYPDEIAARVPPGQRLVKGWPILQYGPIPRFDERSWDFKVSGLVGSPLTVTYEQLKAIGPQRIKADMHCVTGWSTLDNEWEGLPFRTLAEQVEPTPEARWVIAHCEHGYTSNLSLEAMMDDDVLLAWGHNGKPLEPEHGYPLRLVVPKRYAWKSAKWIRGLEFVDRNARGFWEVRGYHNHADPWGEERYSYQETKESETQR